jgi:hypothetical protein
MNANIEAHIVLTPQEQLLVLWAVQDVKHRRLAQRSLDKTNQREAELLESAENKIKDCEWK